MASEAQRLIGISLTKIAQSRSHRGGVSLHKNLLVATVLQKARYIFMEEAYNMVHYQSPAPQQQQQQQEEPELVALTAEEAATPLPADDVHESASSTDFQAFQCVRCSDKENHPPRSELTYLDLDRGAKATAPSSTCLKRRRAVAEWETEEAVQSILPKRSRQELEAACGDDDDDVFFDEHTLAEQVHKDLEKEAPAMEIDRITSLVSIFSFSMGGDAGGGSSSKLNRSVSTPDLCSTQAKDTADTLQQRPFLAMTV